MSPAVQQGLGRGMPLILCQVFIAVRSPGMQDTSQPLGMGGGVPPHAYCTQVM